MEVAVQMKHEILCSDIERQIEKLKLQGLNIINEDYAQLQLSCYGYSNLIKSYREPYTVKLEDGTRRYRSGVSFEQIASLHELDRNIRNAVMAAMQDLEEYIKEQAANVIANSFGTDHDEYLVYRKYQNKRKRVAKFELRAILDTLRKHITSDKDPIHHYYTKYEIVPPWILFKSLYFGTIVNFIDLFKAKEQTEVMKLFLNYEKLKISEDSARILMMNILFISMEYRNNAAHGGRMYDFEPKTKLRNSVIFDEAQDDSSPGFTEFISLLRLLQYKNPYLQLSAVLNQEVNRHCSAFPQDVTYLGQMLNIDIVPCDNVFVSSKSGKYHKNPTCSGMKDALQMEHDEAIQKGFEPCKRCVR